jgi:hypothetical protein
MARSRRILTLSVSALALALLISALALALQSPQAITSRKMVSFLISSGVCLGIVMAALACFNLIQHRIIRGSILAACTAGLGAVLLSEQPTGPVTQLLTGLIMAALAAMALATFRTPPLSEDRELVEMVGALFLLLVPVWSLYSIPATYARQFGFVLATLASMAALWGVPLLLAGLVSFRYRGAAHSLLLNVLVASVAVMFTLGLIEIGVRALGLDQVSAKPASIAVIPAKTVLGTAPDITYFFKPDQVWEERYLAYDALGRVVQDKDIVYRINNEGFRDTDFTPAKPPGTYRIALMGDSFAFGQGARQDQIFAALLEPVLSRRTGCNVEIYNFGIPAYQTINEAAMFQYKALDYHPDMVIVWYFLNDLNIKNFEPVPKHANTNDFFPLAVGGSSLARLVEIRLATIMNTETFIRYNLVSYATNVEKWNQVVQSFHTISQLSSQNHIMPVLFVHPMMYQLNDDYPFKPIHSQVLAAGTDNGFHSYDLLDAFKGQRAESLTVSPTDSHPNEAGHAIDAQYAADKLASLIPPCTAAPN